MFSKYVDYDLDIRFVMYSPVIDGYLAFRVYIEVLNLSTSTVDFQIKFSSSRKRGEVRRSDRKSVV